MNLQAPSEYQANAAQIAAEIGSEVRLLIPDCRVEHVGSSAIPGAISKGDVDVCVVVPAEFHQSAVTRLETAGYVVKADTLRTPELCMLISPRTDADAALQVVAAGSRFEFFMHFRDALIANHSLVERYNDLKRGMSDKSPEAYRDAKSSFVAFVLKTT